MKAFLAFALVCLVGMVGFLYYAYWWAGIPVEYVKYQTSDKGIKVIAKGTAGQVSTTGDERTESFVEVRYKRSGEMVTVFCDKQILLIPVSRIIEVKQQ